MAQHLQDFGPIYAETNFSRFPVEPWNTYSNIIFLAAVVYFAYVTRMDRKKYPLLVVALPLLLIGFIGGTVFHATRSNRIWLLMDFMPIIILCALAAYHFWRTLLKSKVLSFLALFIPYVAIHVLISFFNLPVPITISLRYASLALTLLLPAYLSLWKQHWHGAVFLMNATVSFMCALFFRSIDTGLGAELFPMGTHFLWHLLGGLSVIFLLHFIVISYNQGVRET